MIYVTVPSGRRQDVKLVLSSLSLLSQYLHPKTLTYLGLICLIARVKSISQQET